jgi:hypothetical protein
MFQRSRPNPVAERFSAFSVCHRPFLANQHMRPGVSTTMNRQVGGERAEALGYGVIYFQVAYQSGEPPEEARP